MKLAPLAATALCAGLFSSCESTRTVGYTDGYVTTSNVSYEFVGPPLLQSMQGQSYGVGVAGAAPSVQVTLRSLESHGMRPASSWSAADLRIDISLGEVSQGEATAGRIGGKWYPGFRYTVPYGVTISTSDGQVVARRDYTHSDVLTFSNLQGFATEEEALGMIDLARNMAPEKVRETAHSGTLSKATQTANGMAGTLFEERNIALEVPVVRKAAGLELEEAYQILAEADEPGQVRTALQRYERFGTSQRKADGSPNTTANYGIACGIAASKLMLRDLEGAWDAATLATSFEPRGEEAQQIRRVIYEQEKITGIRVIPDEERAEIEKYEALSESLSGLADRFSD